MAFYPNLQAVSYDSEGRPQVAIQSQKAVDTPFTPAGGLASTDVQNALEELDTEKAPTSHTHAASDIASGQVAPARGGTGSDLSSATRGSLYVVGASGSGVASALAPGTNGYHLRSNGAGADLSWEPVSGGGFTGSTAKKTSAQYIGVYGTAYKVTWDSTAVNNAGSMWNSANNRMIAQKSGVHYISMSMSIVYPTTVAGQYIWYTFKKNGSYVGTGAYQVSDTTGTNYYYQVAHSISLNLSAGDYVEVYAEISYPTIYFNYGHFTMIGPA